MALQKLSSSKVIKRTHTSLKFPRKKKKPRKKMQMRKRIL
jgi:hypothetical protein